MQQVVLMGVGAWMQRHRPNWRVSVHIGSAAELGRRLRDWRGAGALVAEQPTWRGDWLDRLPFPAVNTLGLVEEPRLPSVLGDDRAIGAAVAGHLLERGFRHICWVGGPTGGFSRRRAAGAEAVVTAAGGRWQEWSAVPVRLPAIREPMGFACANDIIARRLLGSLQAAAVRVPETAAVVGINNDPLQCTLDALGLSSCDINLQRRGWEAAALLDRLMQGAPPPPAPVRLAPRGVVTRASSETLAGADAVLIRTWSWLRAHASDEDLRIADLVAASGVSRRSLERRVQAQVGFGLQEALWRTRVAIAKGLLAESDQDLLGIALDSGFRSASAFATVFKRSTGLSPRAWRRRWRCGAHAGEKATAND
ncbi:MAG: substrate-binding domain-containing protein [Planctomycetota bacterium]